MEKMYHINCKQGDLGKYVLLPGDPFRTDLIAEKFDDPQLVAFNREFKSWRGYLSGTKVSVMSTGIGPASAAIAIEELIKIGCHTFIRIGTAGRVSTIAQDRQLQGVIATGAVRDESLTQEYIPLGYPAVADHRIVSALKKAADNKKFNYIEGISHCKESFYGQMEPERIPLGNNLIENWEVWKKGQVACAEMESSTIFVLSSIYKKRAGSLLTFDDNIEEAINVAIESIRILIYEDTLKRES